MLNEDYKDMLQAFADEKVKFLLVGAYALAAHGYPRATIDMDLWVKPDPHNAEAVFRALRQFGAPMHQITVSNFLSDDLIFEIGVAPRRIDILTSLTGLQFDEVYSRSSVVIIEGIPVHIPCLDDLISNKRATGRARDLADAEALEFLRDREGRGGDGE